MKTGKSLEQLVEVIEKALAAKQALTIESPCKMRDKITGRLREHDVVLRAKQGHHCLNIAIECRDRSRMITVGQVEAFHQKCLHTGIDKGVLVSSKGFCATTLKKAEHLGIRCLTLAEAQKLNWLATDHVILHNRSLTNIDLHFFPKAPFNLTADMSRYDLIHPSKGVVPYDRFKPLVNKTLDQIQKTTGTLPQSPISIRFDVSGMAVQHKQTGESIPLSHVLADVSYEITTGTIPFKTYSYGDADHSKQGLDAAVADLDWGSLHGKLVIAKEHGKDGSIVYVPENTVDGSNHVAESD